MPADSYFLLQQGEHRMMKRFLGFLAIVTLLAPTALGADSRHRPNFIVIIADDLGAEDCSPMGHPRVQTPSLQRLASEGLLFRRAFLTCSSCSPSRASIITCRYPHQTGAPQLHLPLPEEQVTFVERLKAAGYWTAASGKWHLGPAANRAFDEVQDEGTAGFQLPAAAEGAAAVMHDKKNASGCAGWVPALQRCPADRPFFLWFAAFDPHRDYETGILTRSHTADDVVVPPYLPETSEVREDLARYYDEITRLDSYVGAVLDELQRRGQAENTYVIFLSDNGRPFPRCKTTLFDSGIQTPLIIRRPGHVPAGTASDALVSSIDLGATILQLSGTEPPEGIEGKSFHEVLSNPAAPHREHVFAEHNWHDFDAYQRAVRTSRLKYIRSFDTEHPLTPPADAVRSPTFQTMRRLRDAGELGASQQQCFDPARPAEELYDLEKDPHELTNLATDPQYADALAALREELDQWRARTYDAALTWRSPDEFDRETGESLPGRLRPRPGIDDGFVPMFSGVDLRGWKPISTPASTWTYEGELLVCSGKPIGELRTERMYQNFILDLQWRHMVPGGNAGIFVWADDITAPGVPFHRGVEVQVLENAYGNTNSHTTHGDIFPIHGATMIPILGRGGSRAFPAEFRSLPSPQWNHYRIVCNQGEVSLAVNGKFVTQGKGAVPSKGYICLESEGGVVHYRNVRIKELPETPIDAAQIANADRGFECLYRGIDLEGWTTAHPGLWQSHDWVLSRVAGEASTGKAPLVTSRTAGPSQWIIDLRRTAESGEIRLHFGDQTLSSSHPKIAEMPVEVGRWDRWTVTLDGQTLTLAINGQVRIDREPFPVPFPTPLGLDCDGATDFANLYVRSLQLD